VCDVTAGMLDRNGKSAINKPPEIG